jgi:hypothetical protein
MRLIEFMKNRNFSSTILYLPFICAILLHMPMVFAGAKASTAGATINLLTEGYENHISVQSDDEIELAYENMNLDEMGLSKQAFNYAIKGFNYLVEKGKLAKDNIISIVDFTQPSSKKRLFVIDLNDCRILFNTYVAHGVNSGREYANQFSNKPSSYKSSLGFYETLNTYIGDNGYSLRLEGLEKGINDNANSRDIVIHGAGYVNESLIRAQGYIGRSWGCPALPEKLHKPIIDKIKDGTCLFIYGADKSYLKQSRIINA